MTNFELLMQSVNKKTANMTIDEKLDFFVFLFNVIDDVLLNQTFELTENGINELEKVV
jgi:hypothetical protein